MAPTDDGAAPEYVDDPLVDTTRENIVFFCARGAYEIVRSYSALFQGVYDISPWTHISPEHRAVIAHGVELQMAYDDRCREDGPDSIDAARVAKNEWCESVFKDGNRRRAWDLAVTTCLTIAPTHVLRVVGEQPSDP